MRGVVPPLKKLSGDDARIEPTEADLRGISFGANFTEAARRLGSGENHPDYDPLIGWRPLTDTRDEVRGAL